MASTYVHQRAGLHLCRDSSETLRVLCNCSDWVTDAVPLLAMHSAWVRGTAHALYGLSPATVSNRPESWTKTALLGPLLLVDRVLPTSPHVASCRN
ncbi:unnamed protein product [Ixodes pacificus]